MKVLLGVFSVFFISFSCQAQTTFVGAISAEWSIEGNWSNGLPAIDNDATIPADKIVSNSGESEIESNFAIDNFGTFNNSSIVNNLGTITNNVGASIVNSGTFTNNGTLFNCGTLEGSFGGTQVLTGTENASGECVVLGCTDSTACNYEASATEDDGSCDDPDFGYDCSGNCISDDNDNGVCDDLECIDANASQFPFVTFNHGCLGTQVITSCGLAGEYSVVSVFANTTYTFQSSNPADICVLSDGSGVICAASSGPVEFTTEMDGEIRFYVQNENCEPESTCRQKTFFLTGVIDTDGDGVCDSFEVVGCQDSNACNYDASATESGVDCVYPSGCEICSGETDGSGTILDNDSDNDGVCNQNEIIGCDDSLACNYNDSTTDATLTCLYASGCDVCSGASDGTGTVIDNDEDNDGVCNADEIEGCQDAAACNFNSSATDNGVACIFPVGCEGCSGETDGSGTVVDDLSDSDGDGICDGDEVAGCQDDSACNYDSDATDDGVACVYAVGACDVCSGATNGTGTVIDNDSDNDGICDTADNCSDTSACNFDDAANGTCETADACGVCGGSGIPVGDCDCNGNTLDALGVCGGTCAADTDSDGICDTADNCTDTSACNFDDAANGTCETVDACGVCGGSGIPVGDCDCNGNTLDALGVCGGTCAADTDSDGICDTADNCTDTSACNFDDAANGTCQTADACGVCGGSGIPVGDCDCNGNTLDALGVCGGTCAADTDSDGICDTADNCTDTSACNFDDAANGTCETVDACGVCGGSGIPVGDCDCNGNTLDALGVCGGTCAADTDSDGICDTADNCTDTSACNFDDAANGTCETVDACGVCGGSGIPVGDCDCNGNTLDALGVCGGTCAADTDSDGICDTADNCTDTSACNFDDAANGTCQTADACGVCGGSGIPVGDCDCNGNTLDALGVCGGTCAADTDSDGICDTADNCTDTSACNFDDAANGTCETVDACGVCGGSGIPVGDCDCNGNTLDALGVCGGTCAADTDSDGICDTADNCTDTSACNFDDAANGTCQTVDACGVCGGSGIPVGDCDCNGNTLDALGVCGGTCAADTDSDGICDTADNCTDTSACNFDDAANGTCETVDACGVCGGSGIPVGDCDCNGNTLDALGVCGGTCAADTDNDGVCDTADNCTDTSNALIYSDFEHTEGGNGNSNSEDDEDDDGNNGASGGSNGYTNGYGTSEVFWSIWNEGGSDCRLAGADASFATSGTRCVRLRDGSSTSNMTTDDLAFSDFEVITITFNFEAQSMENGESFHLEYSTDGGASFETAATYVRGVDFSNSVSYVGWNESISAEFTDVTQFRFRNDASNNNDFIYLDDIYINGCSDGGNAEPCIGGDSDGDGVCDNIDLCTDTNACNYDADANAACQMVDACGVCGGINAAYDADEVDNPTTLIAGDIALTALADDRGNNRNESMLGFVLLRDVGKGTVIHFTSNEWNGTDWIADHNERITWTATKSLAAGQQVILNRIDDNDSNAECLILGCAANFESGGVSDTDYLRGGTSVGAGALTFYGGGVDFWGDAVVWIYQEEDATPRHLYVFGDDLGSNGNTGIGTLIGDDLAVDDLDPVFSFEYTPSNNSQFVLRQASRSALSSTGALGFFEALSDESEYNFHHDPNKIKNISDYIDFEISNAANSISLADGGSVSTDIVVINGNSSVFISEESDCDDIKLYNGSFYSCDGQNRTLKVKGDFARYSVSASFNGGQGIVEFDSTDDQMIDAGNHSSPDSDVSFKKVKIKGGKSLKVKGHVKMKSGGSLEFEDNVDSQKIEMDPNFSSSLTFQSNGTGTAAIGPCTVDNFGMGVNQTFTFERFVPSDTDNSWINIGAYVTGTTVADWTSGVSGMLLFEYNEASYGSQGAGWSYLWDGTAELTPGNGYMALIPAGVSGTISVTGKFEMGDVTLPLTFTDDPNQSDVTVDGWNLVSNPYPAPVNMLSVLAHTENALVTSYYLFDNSGAGSYVETLANGTGDAPTTLDVGQSIWVKVDQTTSITFKESDKVVGASGTFVREHEPSFQGAIGLEIANYSAQWAHAFVRFDETATAAFVPNEDALHLNSEANSDLRIWMEAENGEHLSIQTAGSLANTPSMPLHVTSGAGGDVVFSLLEQEDMPVNVCAVIEDMETGARAQLGVDPFVVNLPANTLYAERFVLHFNAMPSLSLTSSVCDGLDVTELEGEWDAWSLTWSSDDGSVSGEGMPNELTNGHYIFMYSLPSVACSNEIEVEVNAACLGDFNLNGDRDIVDLLFLLAGLPGNNGAVNLDFETADCDCDGAVTVSDMLTFLTVFASQCD